MVRRWVHWHKLSKNMWQARTGEDCPRLLPYAIRQVSTKRFTVLDAPSGRALFGVDFTTLTDAKAAAEAELCCCR